MSAGVQHKMRDRVGHYSRQTSQASCISEANSRQQHLSQTLKRASEIAAMKAKQARIQEARSERRYTWVGVLLILLGVLGAVAAAVTGLAQTLGIFCTIGVGIASVALGVLVLSSNPQPKSTPKNSYAVHALELAQMSAALRA